MITFKVHFDEISLVQLLGAPKFLYSIHSKLHANECVCSKYIRYFCGLHVFNEKNNNKILCCYFSLLFISIWKLTHHYEITRIALVIFVFVFFFRWVYCIVSLVKIKYCFAPSGHLYAQFQWKLLLPFTEVHFATLRNKRPIESKANLFNYTVDFI